MPQKISEVMSRDVQTVSPESTAQEAAGFMLRADAGAIPVTEGERVVGMITDRDIAVRGVAQGRGPETPVRELMTEGAVTARQDDDLESVAILMSDEQVRRIAIVDDGERLVGIVSLADVSRSDQGEAASVALGGVTDPGGEHNQSAEGGSAMQGGESGSVNPQPS
ncbi:CBS domain-containing protein [Sphingomonas sp. BN140010]|uniref:CBS domain-containing protein n=1 Tax=Sphingomonas arvum TaxID=2992113 RepID=A0ABT3JCQ3_9SPHN|nr:CBS domain-containing protein [Sphingomonas sp. BN140010]MCW3796848.1 CBS domain-containing protein [Sphingomonas sp. BN140010]